MSNRTACSELQIIRMAKLPAKVGLSKSEIRSRIKDGDFPQPIPMGPRAMGFLAHEIDHWINQLVMAARCPAKLNQAGAH